MVDAEVLLVRHGQSEWNVLRRWQGRADSPLTALGQSQARFAAAALSEVDVHELHASTSSRATETARILGAAIGIESVRTDERWCEADAGEWQGLTPDEIEAAYPGFLSAHRRPATFESYDRVVARATDALADVARTARPGAATVVVTHSGLIRSLVRSLGVADERIPNLGGVWMRVRRSSTGIGLDLCDRFDPGGLIVSGVDTPGEDPGEQPDHAGAQRRPDR